MLFTVEAYIAAFATINYVPCADGSLEEGWEKVALYALPNPADGPKPTHAARQTVSGNWMSKLGPDQDIIHLKVEDLYGPLYGTVVAYLRRQRTMPVIA